MVYFEFMVDWINYSLTEVWVIEKDIMDVKIARCISCCRPMSQLSNGVFDFCVGFIDWAPSARLLFKLWRTETPCMLTVMVHRNPQLPNVYFYKYQMLFIKRFVDKTNSKTFKCNLLAIKNCN